MPNRIIREGWIDSKTINSLTADEENFFLRICLKADDYGRYHADLKLLRSYLYPLRNDVRDTDIARKLTAVEQAGLIRCYEVSGERYLTIPKFGQRLRAEKSRFPVPPDGCQTDDGHMSDGGQTADGLVGGVVVVEGVGGKPRAGPKARDSDIPCRKQAIDQTAVAGIAPDFAGYVFDQWSSREGKDGAGVRVGWLGYVTRRWKKERGEWMAGTHKGIERNDDDNGSPNI